ncbi:hypothetical protein RGI145_18050 [Roseomonas gilardii]|uniref:Uncharacterized protein n=1 Tax=Roseomonas gilardii TaxID=257708 RepID=A0A1L7AIZ1_9PROT|nr:hypothetical protein [Roseomonas gilardii]APT58722.1 hypothetical protein RGI145_18050 [Roseomonas gilardii]
MRKTFRASLLFSALLLGSAGMAMAQGNVPREVPGGVLGGVQGAAQEPASAAASGPAVTAPAQPQPGSQPRAHAAVAGHAEAPGHKAAGTANTTKAEGHAAATKHLRSGKAGSSSHAAERAPEASAGKASGQVARSQPGTGPATEPPATRVN